MGGSQSQEFMVYTEAGEDLIASCPVCGYAANLEKSISRLEPVAEMESTGDGTPELVLTPGCAAISDVAAFFKISPASDIKCVAYMGTPAPPPLGSLTSKPGDIVAWGIKLNQLRPVVAFLRGDHQVNETKLNAVAGTTELRPMTPEELTLHIGGPAGYLGPIGIGEVMTPDSLTRLKRGEDPQPVDIFKSSGPALKSIVIVDKSLEGRKNLVCGANKLDYHLRNVVPGRDFTWTVSADIRSVNEGESCSVDKKGEPCGGKLVVGKAVEVGHIFKLGRKYTESMGATVLDPNGKEVTPIMGSYGIGIERILTAAIEQSNDANGFWLPPSIAPFTVVVTVTNASDAMLRETGEKLAAELEAAGLDVLLDDRDERAGVKFKDADLVGIPFRINVGKKAASGQVELVTRASGQSVDVALADIVALVKARVAEEFLLDEAV